MRTKVAIKAETLVTIVVVEYSNKEQNFTFKFIGQQHDLFNPIVTRGLTLKYSKLQKDFNRRLSKGILQMQYTAVIGHRYYVKNKILRTVIHQYYSNAFADECSTLHYSQMSNY